MNKLKKISVRLVSFLLAVTVSAALCICYAAEDTAKHETVYVITDSEGNTDKVIVSEWLQNRSGKDKITDQTELENIENVKGEESYTLDENNMTVWDAKGNDIHYQGTVEKLLPVTVFITYKLDGKDVSAKDLAGKSGKLIMRFSYKNNQKESITVKGTSYEMNVPFLMLSGMILDEKVFENAEITNGKIINDGSRTLAVGFALPGMNDNLGELSQEVKLPEYVELTADVTDFRMDTTFTVAINDIFGKIDTNSQKIEDLKNSVSSLDSAAAQLVDGTKTRKEGTSQLADKSGALPAGVAELTNGAGLLQSNLDLISQKTPALSEGVGHLCGGAESLEDGVSELNSKTGELVNGVSALKNNVDLLNSGAAQLEEKSCELASGVQTLENGAAQLNNGAVKVQEGLQMTVSGLDTSVSAISSSLSKTNDAIQALETLAQNMTDESVKGTIEEQIEVLKEQAAVQQTALSGLQSGGQIRTALCDVAQGAQTVVKGTEEFADGLNQFSEQSGALITGIHSLADGSSKLASGANGMYEQLPNLSEGIEQLSDGAGALSGGLQSLQENTKPLISGISKLANGASSLKGGLDELNEKSETLISGIQALDEGADTLSEGMKQFYDEGISVFINLIHNTLPSYLNRVEAVAQAAKHYNSFAGIPEGMDGSTKLIFKSKSIDKD